MRKSGNYILFIDESGKSKLSDDDGYFLLSAVIINKDLHSALSSYMISLKEKSGISPEENIHAFDLFENEKVRDTTGKKISHTKISTFFDRLSSLIEGADMQSLIFRVDKTPFKEMINRAVRRKGGTYRALINYLKRTDLHDFLYEALTRKVILEFGRFLEEEDAYGEVMAESRRQDDEAVLRAFISATHQSTFEEESRCRAWAKSSFRRIYSLTFQNKKGLSFGLEIADLFGWAHLNKQYGRKYPIPSRAKIARINKRLDSVDEMMKTLYRNNPENMTRAKLNTVAKDRVSEFTEKLKEYRSASVPSGTPPGNPGGPYPNTTNKGN